MRTFNLKILGVALFTMFFFVGGFFINIAKSEAAGTVKSFGVSYSVSSVINTTNTDGSITTKVLVGCAPKSGDLYDINTGRPCTNNVKTVLAGCAVGSGDIYDVNTGIPCKSYIKSTILGCAPKSGDIYDINTGKKCTNDTSKVIAKLNKTDTLTQKDLTLLTPVNSEEIALNEKANDGLSGREVLMNSLAASAGKVGSIVKGPMSVWIILLIIAILLGGGYAVYSLLSKKGIKEIVKSDTAKPIIPQSNPQTINPTPNPTVNTQNNLNPNDKVAVENQVNNNQSNNVQK